MSYPFSDFTFVFQRLCPETWLDVTFQIAFHCCHHTALNAVIQLKMRSNRDFCLLDHGCTMCEQVSDVSGCCNSCIYLWPKIILQKVFLWKVLCYDTKYICLAKDFFSPFFNKYTALNVQKLKVDCPVEFYRNKFLMNNSIGLERWSASSWPFT
jgi:hypothetical protein